jgi:Arc/MetJ-type ribon-helix-helix transcriptional regulator
MAGRAAEERGYLLLPGDATEDTVLERAGIHRGLRRFLLLGGLGMTYHHTREVPMSKTKVAVTLDSATLHRLDRLVQMSRFPKRSQAIEAAITEQLARLERRRLAEECTKLDPEAEKALAEEGLGTDAGAWPEY